MHVTALQVIALCGTVHCALGDFEAAFHNTGNQKGTCPEVCPDTNKSVPYSGMDSCQIAAAVEPSTCSFDGYVGYSGTLIPTCNSTSDTAATSSYFLVEIVLIEQLFLLPMLTNQDFQDSALVFEFAETIKKPCEMRAGPISLEASESCGIDLATIKGTEAIGTLTVGATKWETPFVSLPIEHPVVAFVASDVDANCGGGLKSVSLEKMKVSYTATFNPEETDTTDADVTNEEVTTPDSEDNNNNENYEGVLSRWSVLTLGALVTMYLFM